MPTEALRTLRRFETAGHLRQPELDEIGSRIATAEVNYARPESSLLTSQWKLRHNLSAYDAPYVVLGLRFQSPLITLDLRLAQAADVLGVEVHAIQPG